MLGHPRVLGFRVLGIKGFGFRVILVASASSVRVNLRNRKAVKDSPAVGGSRLLYLKPGSMGAYLPREEHQTGEPIMSSLRGFVFEVLFA